MQSNGFFDEYFHIVVHTSAGLRNIPIDGLLHTHEAHTSKRGRRVDFISSHLQRLDVCIKSVPHNSDQF